MDNNRKNIIPKIESDLIIRTSYLAKRGLELISEISPRILVVPSQYKSIEEAINAARNGDIIEISPGKYKEALKIDKSITIQASSGGVELLPLETPKKIIYREKEGYIFSEELPPIVSLTNSNCHVIFDNLHFHGLDAGYYPPALSIEEGKASINNCHFYNFNISFESWAHLDSLSKEGYEDINFTIDLLENSSKVDVHNCHFYNCFGGISINNRCTINLHESSFNNCDNGLSIGPDCSAFFSRNLFQGGGGIVLGRNSKLQSEYDTFVDISDLIHGASGCKAYFYHASVKAHYLLCVGIGKGENLVEVGWGGNYLWEQPILTFMESILIIEWSDLDKRYAASGFSMPNPYEEFNVVESGILQLQKNNFVDCPPFYEEGNPRFGHIDENSVTLLNSSSAINAASDGTNLGAWQG